jgi:hypothetical protein
LTLPRSAPILSCMWWTRYAGQIERVEQALARLRVRLQPREPVPPSDMRRDGEGEEVRLCPIVGRDLCYPVASLLARGKLEEAGQLVSERAWVASVPLYG